MYVKETDVQGALDIVTKARPSVQYVPFVHNLSCKVSQQKIRPNDGFLEQLDVFYRASYRITRWNKSMRMFYLERALDEIISASFSSPLSVRIGKLTSHPRWRRFNPEGQHVRKVPPIAERFGASDARRSSTADTLQDVPPGASSARTHARSRAGWPRHARVDRLACRFSTRIEQRARRCPAFRLDPPDASFETRLCRRCYC